MKKILLVLLLVFVRPSHAVYNANMTGKVIDVLTYTDAAHIFIRLDNQPTSHPTCLPAFFSVDATVDPDKRHQILSRLLTAYATGKPVNIGYDNSGDCSHGYIRVHRVG